MVVVVGGGDGCGGDGCGGVKSFSDQPNFAWITLRFSLEN